MISCTEFIPAYSELFKFIDKKSGRQAVYDYWNMIFQPEKSPLNDYLDQYGIRGCWEYWTVIHIEEACDNSQVFNEQEGWHISCMHSCPSKGRFDKLGYMKPFDEYCKHCDGYEHALNKHGLIQINDFRGDDHACCRTLIYDPKVFKGDPQEWIEKMYQCELNGCTADTTGCIFETPGTIKQTTYPSKLKYLHRHFHTGIARDVDFVLEKYGMDGLVEFLYQFTAAFHVPLIADIKARGLVAVADYMRRLYETEEASDALSVQMGEKDVLFTIHYCPAVKFMKSIGVIPSENYVYSTSLVYQALAELSGIGFEMRAYDHDTGAASFRFFEK